jgi:hypothetical protein
METQEAGWISPEVATSRLVEFAFCFHDSEEVGPAALARIGKDTGLRPEDL